MVDTVLNAITNGITAVFGGVFGVFKWVHNTLDGAGINVWAVYLPVLIGGFVFMISRLPLEYMPIMGYMLLMFPLFAPFPLFVQFYEEWMHFVHTEFATKQGNTTLEVRIPKEVFKSPEAMEQIFMQLYQPSNPDNLVQGLWDGKSPPSFSFEIASREGAVHLYVNTPKKKFKSLIETHFYAQYPGVEIRELDIDYTAEIPSTLDGYGLFGFHFGRGGDQVGPPIRTYVEWGLLDFPKEENKIDPMATTLEAFANIGPGEHMWLQFIITPNKGYNWKTGSLHETKDAKGDFRAAIKKYLEAETGKKDEAGKPIKEARKMGDLSDFEKGQVTAMQRQLNRYLFNTVIRGIYVARNENFNGERIGALASSMRSLDVPGFGAINPGRFRTDVDWPWWQNIGGKTTAKMKKEILKAYKTRGGVWEHDEKDTVFSTEELATLWHIPSSTVTTPTLGRIESTRREAPSNLPV